MLSVALPGGMGMVVEIDPASHRILRSSGSMPGAGNGGRVEFATDYSDFKMVSARCSRSIEENFARRQHTGATTLTEGRGVGDAAEG